MSAGAIKYDDAPSAPALLSGPVRGSPPYRELNSPVAAVCCCPLAVVESTEEIG